LILIAIGIYFGLIAAGVMMLIFPAARRRFVMRLATAWGEAHQRLAHTSHSSSAALEKSGTVVRGCFAQSFLFVRNNPALSATAILVVAVPPILALAIRGPAIFAFQEKAYTPDRQIAVLLQGEQLTPPPPLPPEVFSTREVELIRPDIASANRNWARLDPDFTQRLLLVMKIMHERYGYEMTLIEGFRSPERQAKLANKDGAHVTNAGAYMSYHQYGLAADCAFMLDGKLVISEKDSWALRGYELYGSVAQSVGLTWGGNWKLHDYGHVELKRKGVLGRPVT
jgi:peptidoglycan L-alanyl-D-glutamate endopeptidase CwlK